MTDDPFERVIAREEALRMEQEREREAVLTPAQLKCVVDEGVDVDELYEVLRLELSMSVDDIVCLFCEYHPEAAFFREVERLGHVDRDSAERLLESDVSPRDVLRLRDAVPAASVRDAADLIDEGADVVAIGRDIERYGLGGITVDQLRRLTEDGVELKSVAAIRDAASLSLDDAVELALVDADPAVVARLATGDAPLDSEQLRRVFGDAPRSIVLGVNVRVGRTQQAWGAGRQTVAKDGSVHGVWLGTLRVLPGVNAAINAFVLGDVVVEPNATAEIAGTVTGNVRNRGGKVTVTGSVRGRVLDESA